MELDDLGSRAVQHEADHIDGVLFTDRMSEMAQREVAPVLADFEAQFRRQQQLGKVPPDEEYQGVIGDNRTQVSLIPLRCSGRSTPCPRFRSG